MMITIIMIVFLCLDLYYFISRRRKCKMCFTMKCCTPSSRIPHRVGLKACSEIKKNFFFVLNSAEYEICTANKFQMTNNYKLFLAKHS